MKCSLGISNFLEEISSPSHSVVSLYFWRRSALGFLWREWYWSWNSSTLATSWKSWLIGEDSDGGRDWGQEEKGTTENENGWMASLTGWTWVSELWELVMFREAWCAAIHGIARSLTWLSDWTKLNWIPVIKLNSHQRTKYQEIVSQWEIICCFFSYYFLFLKHWALTFLLHQRVE